MSGTNMQFVDGIELAHVPLPGLIVLLEMYLKTAQTTLELDSNNDMVQPLLTVFGNSLHYLRLFDESIKNIEQAHETLMEARHKLITPPQQCMPLNADAL